MKKLEGELVEKELEEKEAVGSQLDNLTKLSEEAKRGMGTSMGASEQGMVRVRAGHGATRLLEQLTHLSSLLHAPPLLFLDSSSFQCKKSINTCNLL